MTKELAARVAMRLNELEVPADPRHPVCDIIMQWTENGGRLVVTDLPDDETKYEYFSLPRWMP